MFVASDRLNKVAAFLLIKFPKKVQMFDCVGTEPDYKEQIYNEDGVEILYAPICKYVEVFGLDKDEFAWLKSKRGW